MTSIAPYGTWASPITSDLLVEHVVRPGFPIFAGRDVYWVEVRPSEAGRYVLVRRSPDGNTVDAIPEDFAARTLVHEYGGRCHAAHGSALFFTNLSDQRIYRIDAGGDPQPITPQPPSPRAWRYGDLVVTPDGRHLVCIRERHGGAEVLNDLVAVPTDGSGEPVELASGHDFFSSPAISPDATRLAWIAWDHPRMPWDGTFLYEAVIGPDLAPGEPRLVAGGLDESVLEPLYSPNGRLHFVSDRTDWWNLYADEGGEAVPLAAAEAEFAHPPWVFGQRGYGFLPDGRIVARWRRLGTDHLGIVDCGEATEIETPYTAILCAEVGDGAVLVVAAAGDRGLELASIAVGSGEVTTLRRSREATVDDRYLSVPEAIEFPTEGGLAAHAFYYPPQNGDFEAPEGELPPLIVASHGGPTSATSAILDFGIQFWTSRGFAIVDVNYGGSTGYGRPYRDRLKGQWGIVDLDDCVNAALALAERGVIDRRRLLIHGGSAGGYTTLCAVTFRDVFAAGASYFGVADAGALARDTHKFESRYLDSLIGPWPEAEALYEERSPIFHTDRLRTPLILFQGLEDEVVPPAQAEAMAAALREKGVPFAYIAYEGEQHGFRQAPHIKRTAEAELYFYGKVLGFEPADRIEPVEIENAVSLPKAGGRR